MADEDFWFGTLSATVRVENMPGARRIVAVELMESGAWRVCGSGTSNSDGIVEMVIEGNPTSNIYAMAIDDWGRPWEPGMIVAFGDLVRPSVFKGWMYKCTQPGTLPAEEPDWWNAMAEIPQPVGTAMLQAMRHYQPIAHGPVDLTWDEAPPAPELPTIIGEPWGGGFYAGDIESDGQWYKLIVADVSADITGTNSRWKTSNTNTSGTDHLTNGVSNTAAMIAAGIELHPAAAHCINHRGGGNADWYMPAKDELNVIYQNLGFNRPNCPPDFQAGGPQAFSSAYYWASTQYSSDSGWKQQFSGGSQGSGNKANTTRRVGPVRRLQFNP